MNEESAVESLFKGMENDRELWSPIFRDIADYYLPRRLPWLLEGKERSARNLRNSKILNNTGTLAVRTLAAGLMNGITSPARPWLRLAIEGRLESLHGEEQEWLDECASRLRLILAESNFYRAFAMVYLDLPLFGTSAMLVYDDYEDVARFYNLAMGEFSVAQDHRMEISTLGRTINLTLDQVRSWWGLPPQLEAEWSRGGAAQHRQLDVCHLIEPNSAMPWALRPAFKFREYYWIKGRLSTDGFLTRQGFRDKPFICPRWETLANDSYGTSPAFDALNDVKQLQLMEKLKAQGLDKMVNPPVLIDAALQHMPVSLLPRGQTYVASLAQTPGVRPALELRIPIAEVSQDLAMVENRIKMTLHSDLFRGITELQTVRSASEIDARMQEKLVLLGPVLERFENEALDPVIKRVFAIASRKGLLPPAPPSLEGKSISIHYRSIMGDAQRAAATGSTERFLAMLGQLIQVAPETRLIPDFDTIIRDYASSLNVPEKHLNTREEVQAMQQQEREAAAAAQAAQVAQVGADAAQSLSQTPVGAGRSALQEVLGV